MAAPWFIIGNPSAGKIKPTDLIRILDQLTAAFPNSKSAVSQYAGEAELHARKARQNGWDRFIVVGGDGSLNEVLNGLLHANVSDRPEPTVTCYPAGSGNDWARAIGIPRKIKGFIELLKNGHPTPVHAGRINYERNERTFVRFFINISGMAYGAEVARAMTGKRYKIPRLSYLAAAVKRIFTYKGVRLVLEANDYRFEGECFTLHVGVQPFAGGGMHLLPHAKDHPGQLAVTIIEQKHWLRILLSLHYLYNGKITSLPFAHGLHAGSVTVRHFEAPVPLEADGDFLGYSPVHYDIAPNAFLTIVPA
jgi:diacylglycerol kinase (ATP)